MSGTVDGQIIARRLVTAMTAGLDHRISLILTSKLTPQSTDLDLFTILDNPPSTDPLNVAPFVRAVDRVRKEADAIERQGVARLTIFSSFRVQEYLSELTRMHTEQWVPVHLLLYPSLDFFVAVEREGLVRSISRQHELLYGDSGPLKQAAAKLPVRSLPDRLWPLILLALDTYRDAAYGMRGPDSLRRLALRHGCAKLSYAMRYIVWEAVRDRSSELPPIEDPALQELAHDVEVPQELITAWQRVSACDPEPQPEAFLASCETALRALSGLIADITQSGDPSVVRGVSR